MLTLIALSAEKAWAFLTLGNCEQKASGSHELESTCCICLGFYNARLVCRHKRCSSSLFHCCCFADPVARFWVELELGVVENGSRLVRGASVRIDTARLLLFQVGIDRERATMKLRSWSIVLFL